MNLSKRGTESPGSLRNRINSVKDELVIWRKLLEDSYENCTVMEVVDWAFSEYRYQESDKSDLLRMAKERLLNEDKSMAVYFK